MANGKENSKSVPLYDFYKSNGADTGTYIEGPSLTRQEFADECDINNLMKRYEAHAGTGAGFMPRDPNVQPFYADFCSMPDNLIDYMEMMSNAETAFMQLPGTVRKEFDNSALRFVEFAQDPANLEQMRTWGLAAPAKPQEASPAVASPAPASPSGDAPKAS